MMRDDDYDNDADDDDLRWFPIVMVYKVFCNIYSLFFSVTDCKLCREWGLCLKTL